MVSVKIYAHFHTRGISSSSIGILVDGGFAEFVTLRSEAIVAVPEDMDPTQVAPLLCAGASCFGA